MALGAAPNGLSVSPPVVRSCRCVVAGHVARAVAVPVPHERRPATANARSKERARARDDWPSARGTDACQQAAAQAQEEVSATAAPTRCALALLPAAAAAARLTSTWPHRAPSAHCRRSSSSEGREDEAEGAPGKATAHAHAQVHAPQAELALPDGSCRPIARSGKFKFECSELSSRGNSYEIRTGRRGLYDKRRSGTIVRRCAIRIRMVVSRAGRT